MADCPDEHGDPLINHEPKFGQLEMIKAMLVLTDLLLDFGYFRKSLVDVNLHNSGFQFDKFKASDNVEVTADVLPAAEAEARVMKKKSTLRNFKQSGKNVKHEILTRPAVQYPHAYVIIKELCRSLFSLLHARI